MASLAAGWAAYEDGEGRTYYANAATGETSWEAPAPSALPDGWAAYQDDEGRTYYANVNTGETSWEPPAGGAAAPPAEPAVIMGNWSIDNTYTIGPDGSEHIFTGKCMLLDRALYSSVGSVVNSLNAGTPDVPDGYCVVFSASKQNYFLLWREGVESQAFAAIGQGGDEKWSASQCRSLCQPGQEDQFAGRCHCLDTGRYDSVTAAVEALNAGQCVEEGAAGYVVVYSASQGSYHLLWQKDKEAEAFAALGLS
mmetsp:Transcript_9633/g.17309  ORF Transcript_9633/g.17309 Transcript_9633/m.17309 type:complete len:253 (-) Transcript_9633:50-808(-)